MQYGEDQGPCLPAMTTGEVVIVEDLAAEVRWPGYRVRALGYGVRSSLSVPLVLDGAPRGALNVYSTAPGCSARWPERGGELFAGHAAATIS